MDIERDPAADLLSDALRGNEEALGRLFHLHRARLRQMIRLRLNPRIQARVDPSDVLQDAFLDIQKRISGYARTPHVPFFLWLRTLVAQRLVDLHRRHLGARMRDARLEISLSGGPLPYATSESLAAQLLGKLTSPSRAAERMENQILVQRTLNAMEPLDCEILALRHFEMLSNAECAEVLGISKTAASNRYLRALKRIKETLEPPSPTPRRRSGFRKAISR